MEEKKKGNARQKEEETRKTDTNNCRVLDMDWLAFSCFSCPQIQSLAFVQGEAKNVGKSSALTTALRKKRLADQNPMGFYIKCVTCLRQWFQNASKLFHFFFENYAFFALKVERFREHWAKMPAMQILLAKFFCSPSKRRLSRVLVGFTEREKIQNANQSESNTLLYAGVS